MKMVVTHKTYMVQMWLLFWILSINVITVIKDVLTIEVVSIDVVVTFDVVIIDMVTIDVVTIDLVRMTMLW